MIGQACEALARKASDAAVEARLAALPHASKIRALHDSANAIPVSKRRAWLTSDGHEEHTGDLESWLHAANGTPFNKETGAFAGAAPRVVTVSTRPPKGARQRILAEVAKRYDISKDTADRLWKAYRRFERATRPD